MPIKDRNLKPGTHLVGRYHKQSYSCEVVEGEGGKLRYRLADGRGFTSLSAAGTTITGQACNGWKFWSVTAITPEPAPEVKTDPEPDPKTETILNSKPARDAKGHFIKAEAV